MLDRALRLTCFAVTELRGGERMRAALSNIGSPPLRYRIGLEIEAKGRAARNERAGLIRRVMEAAPRKRIRAVLLCEFGRSGARKAAPLLGPTPP